MVPLYSGYRDPDTQRVKIDLDYSLALIKYAELVNRGETKGIDARVDPPKDMSVVIPISEIALIRRFDEELVDSFIPIEGDDQVHAEQDVFGSNPRL